MTRDLRSLEPLAPEAVHSYYVATSLGEAVMGHGIGELIRTEWDALERYS